MFNTLLRMDLCHLKFVCKTVTFEVGTGTPCYFSLFRVMSYNTKEIYWQTFIGSGCVQLCDVVAGGTGIARKPVET